MIAAGLRATLVGMLWVGLIYAAAETRALAQDHPKAKTEVGIIFEMPDPRYTDEFKNEVIPALMEAAAAAIARV